MKFSTVKTIKQFCETLVSSPDYREVLQHIIKSDINFEVDGVRFIKSDDIDSIQCEELSNDLYSLGFFNSWFISDVIGIDCEVIDAMQKAEAFEAIGKLIVSLGKLEELQEAYASADGYGHHFNHYDSGMEEFKISDPVIGEYLFYVFDNRD